jgi:heptosyltransferase-2
MAQIDCRFFNGYKPCGKNSSCSSNCPSYSPVVEKIVLIHLGALGAVVRSTALLAEIKHKYPQSHLTWITDAPAHKLLENHPLIDRVLTTSSEDLLSVKGHCFDVGFVIDKSLKALGVVSDLKIHQRFGFQLSSYNNIVPATSAAEELWQLGLSNHKKFFLNQKSEVQLVLEALELYRGVVPDYHLPLTPAEQRLVLEKRKLWQQVPQSPIVGLNTGCSHVIPAKKLSVSMHREVIQELLSLGYSNIVLLGGPEDTQRNFEIGQGLPVIQSQTELGLREGLTSVGACDVVLTGDSLGMHMAIALKKYVVAWFGPTCAHEIELYGRGEKILTKASCAPCWKRSCSEKVMCYDQVNKQELLAALLRGVEKCQHSLFTLPF